MTTRMNCIVSFCGVICTFMHGIAFDTLDKSFGVVECWKGAVITHGDAQVVLCEADVAESSWQSILDLEEEQKWRNLVSFGRCSSRKSANLSLFAINKFSLLTGSTISVCWMREMPSWRNMTFRVLLWRYPQKRAKRG